MADTKQQEAPEAVAEYRPTELEGMSITYRGGKNKLNEAVFMKEDKRWGAIAGDLNESNMREQAQRAMRKYLRWQEAQRAKESES